MTETEILGPRVNWIRQCFTVLEVLEEQVAMLKEIVQYVSSMDSLTNGFFFPQMKLDIFGFL